MINEEFAKRVESVRTKLYKTALTYLGSESLADAVENEYGDADADGNITYFYDEFPLLNFTGDEVWLSPHYSHNWVAEDQIVITVQ